ncbi:MAG: serine/threonine-protein kinase [Deltaproteobacteria bacterium]|nr:serine/threonine-protein kinase [Deltaproteobacteria bacterium]
MSREEAETEARVGTVIGSYRLGEVLGRGGMGTVYRGEHIYIGKQAAIKILHPQFAGKDEAVKRFLREAWAASTINHPNIVDIVDFGEHNDGSVFLVMEYLRGQPLDRVLADTGAISLLRAISITSQMTHALAAAHARGIFHRDLKPENVIVDVRPGRRQLSRTAPSGGGRNATTETETAFDFVKLLDFGVAKVLQQAQELDLDDPSPSSMPGVFDALLTHGDVIFGTPEYMAPEVARGAHADPRTDVYAVAAMFYEMVTGQVPLQGATPMDTLLKQVTDSVVLPTVRAPNAEITPACEQLIMKALSKDPAKRHQSMPELHDALYSCYGVLRYHRKLDLMIQPARSTAAPLLLTNAKRKLPMPVSESPVPLTRVKAALASLDAEYDTPVQNRPAQGAGPVRRGTLPLGVAPIPGGSRDEET